MRQFFQINTVQHIMAWIAIFFFTAVRFTLYDDPAPVLAALVYNLPYIFPQMAMAYLMLYVLVPRFYVKKRYAAFLFSFFSALYIAAFVARVGTVHCAETLIRPRPFEQESIYEIATDLGSLFGRYGVSVLYVVGLFLAFIYFKAYHQEREKALLLENQKSKAELQNLKAQLHPHFLFNTLNNIYSLAILQSPQTPVAIAKLSELLDYTLYRSNADLAPVSKELALVEHYIELEKLRYTDRLNITLQADIQYDAMIPPLVLLSLVENAFKHGSGEDLASPVINIIVKSNVNALHLTVANTWRPAKTGRLDVPIGLNNIRQQLQLLFPNQHTLEANTEGDWFNVNLEIRQRA